MLMETREWQRPDQLKVTNMDPRFSYKYMRKSDVERRIEEGWVICRKGNKVVNEVTSTDGAIHYRSMILMMCPKAMQERRNQYYIDKHHRRLRAVGKGASLQSAADNLNRGAGGRVTGVLGSGLQIKTGLNREDGMQFRDTKDYPVGRVESEDVESLQETYQDKIEHEKEVERVDSEILSPLKTESPKQEVKRGRGRPRKK